jgi:hypothetical protein
MENEITEVFKYAKSETDIKITEALIDLCRKNFRF